MPIYRCRFVGRKRGAIGIEYPILVNFTATDPNDARRQCDETYERFHSRTIEELPDPSRQPSATLDTDPTE